MNPLGRVAQLLESMCNQLSQSALSECFQRLVKLADTTALDPEEADALREIVGTLLRLFSKDSRYAGNVWLPFFVRLS